ncbi:putative LPS assembly protein LptD [Gangjinia marincola]|uniref:LPS assembly protein LptD n=1 Tax=Gangjinia marincola TaxID=578463 RepID=A0ABN1MD06_9FLAO
MTAQELKTGRELSIEAKKDSIASSSQTPIPATVQDSIKKDTITEQKTTFLTDQVVYKAKDYMRLSRKENRMYLYNEAEITYGDVNIKAGLIILDNEKNEIYAYGIRDTADVYTQSPVFTQANSVVEPDSIRFNFDTEKALVYNSRTNEGGFNVKGAVTKRENDSVYYMRNVKFTTAEDVDDPEYYFFARRIKFVPEKKIVTGLVNMYIEDVPTPLGLPFGYFPLTDEEVSGFIIPSYGERRNRGYFLQNGGYYFALSEYVNLTVLGDYYTNGSYGIRTQSEYGVRYRFRGNVNLRYERLVEGERGFPGFSEGDTYNIQWSHSQDAKANPTSRFSASVNLGSSRFFQQSLNQSNTANFLNNNLSSSISYQKTFDVEPQINIALTATHSQNSNTEEINMTLPTLQANIARLFPFAPKNGTKKGLIQNINLQYNLRAENRFSTTDSLFFKEEMFDDAIYGAQHTIPVSTNFKVAKYLSVTAGTNFRENWVFRTFRQSYDDINNEVVTDTVAGFESWRTYNFSTNVGTTLYGRVDFDKKNKIQALRHVIRPSISYTLTPGFDQYYDEYVIPANDIRPEEERVSYTRFQGTLYGTPNENMSSNIGFSITNDIEAKIRPKDTLDVEAEPRKIKLISNLGFSTSYNIAADSLNLAPITFRGNIPVVQNKLDINFTGQMDPYALNSSNQRIDKLNINNGGSLFRLTRGNVSFGYNFSSRDFERGAVKDEDPNLGIDEVDQAILNGSRPDDLLGQTRTLNDRGLPKSVSDPNLNRDGNNEDNDYYNYKIPWNLRMSYSMNYTNNARQNEITAHSVDFSGDVELSPMWSLGFSSSYDLTDNSFRPPQLNFRRELKSWYMTFNWTPYGNRAQWFFFIGIKAGALRDIKYDKNREPDRRL